MEQQACYSFCGCQTYRLDRCRPFAIATYRYNRSGRSASKAWSWHSLQLHTPWSISYIFCRIHHHRRHSQPDVSNTPQISNDQEEPTRQREEWHLLVFAILTWIVTGSVPAVESSIGVNTHPYCLTIYSYTSIITLTCSYGLRWT
jgi:hypothetical protein